MAGQFEDVVKRPLARDASGKALSVDDWQRLVPVSGELRERVAQWLANAWNITHGAPEGQRSSPADWLDVAEYVADDVAAYGARCANKARQDTAAYLIRVADNVRAGRK